MIRLTNRLTEIGLSLRSFINWMLLGVILGAAGGAIGGVFHLCVDSVTFARNTYQWLIWLLPVGGAVIALLYKVTQVRTGANDVLYATRTDRRLPFLMLPLIFVSTLITQLVGGSAGKEGAAVQMGGTLGYQLGKAMKLDEKDCHVAVMIGLAAVFAAVFGTPIAACVFSLEVISIGAMYYVALIPCLTAVLTAKTVSVLLGCTPLSFEIYLPELNVPHLGAVILLSVICALVSIGFALALHRGSRLMSKLIPDTVLRGILGGIAVLALTLLVGNRDYNGAGFNLVNGAMAGETPAYAFLLKMLFTVVTISFGFKGGEIVPTMAIGATLGCAAAKLLGLDPSFLAGIGLIAMFCAMVNCPLASIFMGLELFGMEGLMYYAAAAAIAFALSGNYGLYSGQKLLYSKLKAEFINEQIRE